MYNNYGFNPYYQPQRFTGIQQQPLEQPMQNMQSSLQNSAVPTRPILNGKQVDSIDVVKAMDIPLDGSISYFPLTDGSAIVSKKLQMDGTSKMIIYKPVKEDSDEGSKFVTFEEMQKELVKIDLSDLDELKDEMKDLKSELKEIQKKLKSKGE